MKLKSLILATLVAIATSAHAAVLVAGWDFQTTTNGGTAILAAPSTQTSFVANFGTGTIYLDGTHGSSTFLTTTGTNQLGAASGSNLNLATGFSSTTTTPAAMLLTNASAGNIINKTFSFTFDMTNLNTLTLSYASQVSAGNVAANSTLWEYSTNGTSWTTIQSVVATASYAVYTLNPVTALDGVATAYVRGTISAASSGGTVRFDNIQLNAIPEPASSALALGGLGMMTWMLRRRRSHRP
ncbi:hypothetical protein BH09VER1_BH09VER1_41300 [soil metagenome]